MGPLPTLRPSDKMLTLVPLAAVPVKVGVFTFVMPSPLVPESLAAASAGFDGAVSWTTTPLPLSATLCGLLGALSVKDRLPVRAPWAAGLKTTDTTQFWPGVSVLPLHRLALMGKSAEEEVILPTARAPAPELVSVTFCGALLAPTCCGAKLRLVGLRLAAPCGAGVPLPLRGTVWMMPGASSWKTSIALRAPVAVGANLTATLHDPPAGTTAAVQVLGPSAKSAGFRFDRLTLA